MVGAGEAGGLVLGQESEWGQWRVLERTVGGAQLRECPVPPDQAPRDGRDGEFHGVCSNTGTSEGGCMLK